jgi:hypothetical protein
MSCFGWGTKTGKKLSAPGSSTRVSDLRWKAGWGRLERERERERERGKMSSHLPAREQRGSGEEEETIIEGEH